MWQKRRGSTLWLDLFARALSLCYWPLGPGCSSTSVPPLLNHPTDNSFWVFSGIKSRCYWPGRKIWPHRAGKAQEDFPPKLIALIAHGGVICGRQRKSLAFFLPRRGQSRESSCEKNSFEEGKTNFYLELAFIWDVNG